MRALPYEDDLNSEPINGNGGAGNIMADINDILNGSLPPVYVGGGLANPPAGYTYELDNNGNYVLIRIDDGIKNGDISMDGVREFPPYVPNLQDFILPQSATKCARRQAPAGYKYLLNAKGECVLVRLAQQVEVISKANAGSQPTTTTALAGDTGIVAKATAWVTANPILAIALIGGGLYFASKK